MTDALRYEWLRLKTLRSTWWLTGIALLTSGLLALTALGIHSGPLTLDDYGAVVTQPGLFFASIFLSLIGVFSLGHEYRYGTIRPTLNAVPRRSILMTAKVAVVFCYVTLIVVLCQVINYVVSVLILGSRLTSLGFAPGFIGRLWAGSIGYIVVYALIGLALAGLTRSMPAAIVILLLFPLLAENLIKALLSLSFLSSIRGLAKFLPFSAGQQIFSYDPTAANDAPSGFRENLSPWTGALTYVIFMSVLLAICWVMFEKRDA